MADAEEEDGDSPRDCTRATVCGYGRKVSGGQTETALGVAEGRDASPWRIYGLTLSIRQVVVPKDCSSLLGLDTKIPLVTVPSSVAEINIILNQTLSNRGMIFSDCLSLRGQAAKTD